MMAGTSDDKTIYRRLNPGLVSIARLFMLSEANDHNKSFPETRNSRRDCGDDSKEMRKLTLQNNTNTHTLFYLVRAYCGCRHLCRVASAVCCSESVAET